MKKLSAVVFVLLLAGAVYAQPPAGKDFRGPKGPDMEKMQIILELSDEQMAQWTELHESHRVAMETRRGELYKEREEAMKAHQNELKKILTPEQYTKFEAMRPERPGPAEGMEGMGRRQGNQPGGEQINKNDCLYKKGNP